MFDVRVLLGDGRVLSLELVGVVRCNVLRVFLVLLHQQLGVIVARVKQLYQGLTLTATCKRQGIVSQGIAAKCLLCRGILLQDELLQVGLFVLRNLARDAHEMALV